MKDIVAYKIDSYPMLNNDALNIWYIGKDDNAYCAIVDNTGVMLSPPTNHGPKRFVEITVGESGIWGIDKNGRVHRFLDVTGKYDCVSGQWKSLELDNYRWISIESASPKSYFYAIDKESRVYLRDGISSGEPTGLKWRYTGILAKQISSGSYATYFTLPTGELKYFSGKPNIPGKVFLSGNHKEFAQNKISAGFDGSVVKLNDKGQILVLDEFSMDTLSNDKVWKWNTIAQDTDVTDVSAGPILFAIWNNKIIMKPGEFFVKYDIYLCISLLFLDPGFTQWGP